MQGNFRKITVRIGGKANEALSCIRDMGETNITQVIELALIHYAYLLKENLRQDVDQIEDRVTVLEDVVFGDGK